MPPVHAPTRDTPSRSINGKPDREPAALWDLVAILVEAHRRTQTPAGSRASRIRLSLPVAHLDLWLREWVQRDLIALLELSFDRRFAIDLTPRSRAGDAAARPAITAIEHGDPPGSPASVVAFWPSFDSLAGILASRHARGPVAALASLDIGNTPGRAERGPGELARSLEAIVEPNSAYLVAGQMTIRDQCADFGDAHLLRLVWAAIIAWRLGVGRVQFFENGIDNRYLPFGARVLASMEALAGRAGTPARPVSPEMVAILQRVVREAIEDDFCITNPFTDLTPSQIAAAVVDTDRAPVLHGVMKKLVQDDCQSYPHETIIDYCVAMLGAHLSGVHLSGAESSQIDTAYFFSMLSTVTSSRVTEVYVGNVRSLALLSDQELLSRLSALGLAGGGAPVGAQTSELVRRHLSSVRQVLIELVRRNADDLVDGVVPTTSLMTRVSSPPHAASCDRQSTMPTFRRHETCWELRYLDGEPLYLKHVDGMAYIHILVQNQQRSHSALDLRWLVTGRPASVGTRDGDMSDDKAIAEYVDAARERRQALRIAKQINDVVRAEKLTQELAWLEGEINRCRGLGGRQRDMGDREHARKSVCNAVRRALAQIASRHASLASHLDSALELGGHLRYAPREPIRWLT